MLISSAGACPNNGEGEDDRVDAKNKSCIQSCLLIESEMEELSLSFVSMGGSSKVLEGRDREGLSIHSAVSNLLSVMQRYIH